MEKSRLPYGVNCLGRSALGGEHPCGPAHEAMPAASQRAPYCKRWTGLAERRPDPNEGKADVVEEDTGRGTPRAAGGGGQARRDRDAERTSGRSCSPQGLTATCPDRVVRGRPRHKEGEGLAPEPGGAMQVGAYPPTGGVPS